MEGCHSFVNFLADRLLQLVNFFVSGFHSFLVDRLSDFFVDSFVLVDRLAGLQIAISHQTKTVQVR